MVRLVANKDGYTSTDESPLNVSAITNFPSVLNTDNSRINRIRQPGCPASGAPHLEAKNGVVQDVHIVRVISKRIPYHWKIQSPTELGVHRAIISFARRLAPSAKTSAHESAFKGSKRRSLAGRPDHIEVLKVFVEVYGSTCPGWDTVATGDYQHEGHADSDDGALRTLCPDQAGNLCEKHNRQLGVPQLQD